MRKGNDHRDCDVCSAVIAHPRLVRVLREIADKKGIAYQLEILPAGGTDSGVMQRYRGGTVAGTLSIPTRYVHSTVESCHVRDIQATVDLLAAFLEDGQAFFKTA